VRLGPQAPAGVQGAPARGEGPVVAVRGCAPRVGGRPGRRGSARESINPPEQAQVSPSSSQPAGQACVHAAGGAGRGCGAQCALIRPPRGLRDGGRGPGAPGGAPGGAGRARGPGRPPAARGRPPPGASAAIHLFDALEALKGGGAPLGATSRRRLGRRHAGAAGRGARSGEGCVEARRAGGRGPGDARGRRDTSWDLFVGPLRRTGGAGRCGRGARGPL
jgi:translation initiation factor IF-2